MPMPPDIDPQSGFRLPLPKRDDLDETGKRAYDHAAAPGKSIVGLRGPAGICLYSPNTAEVRTKFNNYLRFEVFGAKIREVAILTVAREMDSQFEWAAHEPEALKEGVPAEVIDVIKHQQEHPRSRRDLRGDHRARAAGIRRPQGYPAGVCTDQETDRTRQARRTCAADGQLRVHRSLAHGVRHASAGRQAAASGALTCRPPKTGTQYSHL